MSDLTMTRGTGNVFADLGFDAEEARNLLLRSQTMMALEGWYRASGLTQARAAKELGITQPRLSQLLKGKISEFSLDALVNMAPRAGMRVGLTINPAPKVRMAPVKAMPATAKEAGRRSGRQTAPA